MKRNSFTLFLFLFSVLVFSQNEREKIQNYLNNNLSKFDLTIQDVSDWIVKSKSTSKTTKITNFYINQRYQGIELFNALSNVAVKNNEVIFIGNRFVKNCASKINSTQPQLSVLEALSKAKIAIEINTNYIPTIEKVIDTRTFIISNYEKADKIKAKLVFHLNKVNQLKLAWDFYIHDPKENHMWNVQIDALTGTLLAKNDYMVSCSFDGENRCNLQLTHHFNAFPNKQSSTLLDVQSGSYRVLPFTTESPNHGPLQLVVNPHNVAASPFGWHDVNGISGAEFTITRGNNVHAFEDLENDNDPETNLSPDGGPALIFDFPYLGTTTPAINYLDAATTNLFYMNNVIHDVFHHYGFDEENGNFQQKNYTNSGEENDHVLAQAQDGGGFNNANFGTPPDGDNGRMQMYIWNRKGGANIITINSPANIAGTYTAFDNGFISGSVDLPQAPNNLTADLILASDSIDEPNDGCSPLSNATDINGKIVVIKRGTCTNVIKVLNAQQAGAVAVIIANTLPGNLFVGGFGDEEITIPVISVKKDTGDLIIDAIQNSTVSVSLSEPFTDFVNTDSDFDNLVIAHEYGHGISNRLTGGANSSSCLFNQEQMGEGWSDWFGLMLQMKNTDNGALRRGIGSFVINQPTNDDGIRTYPYSTDMAINPFTFEDTNTLARPHGVGSVWATMLWDLSWAYVQKYGFDPNLYTGNGGNNKVLQLVVDGLKLQPCSPSFIEARDALIAADQATTGGQDFCMIWEVFARRGLGLNASSGDGDDSTDQVEDFSVPAPGPNCTLSVDYFQNQNLFAIYPNPTDGLLNIKINNFIGKASIQVIDNNGRIIFNTVNQDFNNESTIDLSELSMGIYFIKVNADNFNFVEKVVIK